MSLAKRELSAFVPHPESGVLIHPTYQGFSYSDGDDVEKRIYEGLRSAKDTSCDSEDLQRLIVDWPSEYHFSRARYNLLRHISFNKDERILELGAGCGSITRQLGETGADVTAIEGSHNRARCAKERCRDLSSVTVFCSNFQDVELVTQYDVVTLIGVLEYSALFIESEDPITDCLRMAQRALRPGGRLIVAIENQLGLKYFSGITEDHLAVAYAGIEDRYQVKGVRTLGQVELKRKIADAGFRHVEFQYPFPDYKLPRYIFFEQAFTHAGFMPDEIIRHLHTRDYSGRGKEIIDLALVWPVVARNGLAQALSNSFLIIASDDASAATCCPTDTLAVGYATDRSVRFCTSTRFSKGTAGAVTVEKSSLGRIDSTETGSMRQSLGTEEYIRGITLHSKLYSCSKRGDFEGVIAGLQAWMNFVHDAVGTAKSIPLWDQVIPPQYVDCLPPNLVLADGKLIFVDREWAYTGELTLGSLLLRYLTVVIEQRHFCQLLRDQGATGQARGIRLILDRLGLRPRENAYRSYLQLHRDIDSQVFPWRARYENSELELALTQKNWVDPRTEVEVAPSSGGRGSIVRNFLRSLKT